jgi:hypothetical protein
VEAYSVKENGLQVKLILSLILIIFALAGSIGVKHWHEQKVEQAYKLGKDHANLEKARAENLSLKNLQERLYVLIDENKATQNEKVKLEDKIRQFSARDNNSSGLRKQQELEYRANLATANAENLRRSAEACDGNFTRSREHVKRFGLEAAECSRTAEVQRRDLDSWEKAINGSLPKLPDLPQLPK